jgi:hypothetical protein
VVEADYFFNKSYIAKVLCVNKEKPKSHCSGKCYLTKQLKEQDKQHEQVPVTKKAKIEVQLFYNCQANLSPAYTQQSNVTYLPIDVMLLSTYTHSIFRPPTV